MNGRVEYFDEAPVDRAACDYDESFLNMVSWIGPGVEVGASDEELLAVLVAWQDVVDEEPIGDLVDIDTALAAIRSQIQAADGRLERIQTIAAAALIFSVVTLTLLRLDLAPIQGFYVSAWANLCHAVGVVVRFVLSLPWALDRL